jgi:S1-C subfamily serine protease
VNRALEIGAVIFVALIYLVVSFVAGFVLSGTLGCVSPSHGLTIKQQHKRTVQILVLCDSGKVGAGSGVIVAKNQVLTANHVVDCAGELPKQIEVSGKVATVESFDSSSDTALLTVRGLGGSVEKLVIGRTPEQGDELCKTAATPLPSRHCGTVWPGATLHFGALGFPGNSGGPVWDSGGSIVGIVTHSIACDTNKICGSIAIPLQELFK